MSATATTQMTTELLNADMSCVAASCSLVQSDARREINSPDLAASKKAASCRSRLAKRRARSLATTFSPAMPNARLRAKDMTAPAPSSATSESVVPCSSLASFTAAESMSPPKNLGTRRSARELSTIATKPKVSAGHSVMASARMRPRLPPPSCAAAGAPSTAGAPSASASVVGGRRGARIAGCGRAVDVAQRSAANCTAASAQPPPTAHKRAWMVVGGSAAPAPPCAAWTSSTADATRSSTVARVSHTARTSARAGAYASNSEPAPRSASEPAKTQAAGSSRKCAADHQRPSPAAGDAAR
mmetsp:Transcript_424/g.1143  ORF Transcript_424/g.1143 Transcript_424/m.1143 type:complete len:301 (-) Transcript_424:87-989(-)